MRRIWWRHFIFDFSLFAIYLVTGSLFCVLGAAFGIYEWIMSARTGQPATGGTVMLAALPVIAGLQLLLQMVMMDIVSVPTSPLCANVPISQRTKKSEQVPAETA